MPSRKQDKGGPDAIHLLKLDHETVRRLFEEFEQAGADRKFELATQICQALTVHATLEEEIFYPRARDAIEAEDLMLEAAIEHDTVKQLIERIQEGDVDETQLSAIIKVMNEYVNHHVNEEHRRLFPCVKRSRIDLDELGQQLRARKNELESELQAAITDESGVGDDAFGQTRGGIAARGASGDG